MNIRIVTPTMAIIELDNGLRIKVNQQGPASAALDVSNDGNSRINIRHISMTASTVAMTVHDERELSQ